MLSWKEGNDKFENSFSTARTEYLLKKAELNADIDFYLNMCTEKGCSDRTDPCRIPHTIEPEKNGESTKGQYFLLIPFKQFGRSRPKMFTRFM